MNAKHSSYISNCIKQVILKNNRTIKFDNIAMNVKHPSYLTHGNIVVLEKQLHDWSTQMKLYFV